jgi:hypothetical protein
MSIQQSYAHLSEELKPAHRLHPRVMGIGLDPQMRCAHYHSTLDIIAIKASPVARPQLEKLDRQSFPPHCSTAPMDVECNYSNYLQIEC